MAFLKSATVAAVIQGIIIVRVFGKLDCTDYVNETLLEEAKNQGKNLNMEQNLIKCIDAQKFDKNAT